MSISRRSAMPRAIIHTLACVLVVASCSSPSEVGTNVATELTHRAQIRPMKFPNLSDFQSEKTVDLARFAVSKAQAAAYACGHILAGTYLGSRPQLCLAFPVVDRNASLVAWSFIFATGGADADCADWALSLDRTRGYWRKTREKGQGGKHLFRALLASVGEFYSISVNAFSFRHPLREAHAGVAPWLLRAALNDAHARNCEPVALSPLADSSREEANAIRYRCGDRTIDLDHRDTSFRVVGKTELAVPIDSTTDFQRLRRKTLAKYGAQLNDRINFLRHRWTSVGGQR